MKKLPCLFLCALLLLSSCNTVNKSALIYYIPSEPVTLDPQSVSDEYGRTVVYNTFTGLMQCYDGVAEPAAAESYEEYGNRVVFTLKENLKWKNGDPLTADDFVFGFQRLLSAETCSVEASRFFFLRGAENYYNGETSVFSSVKNEDGKVVFYLNYMPNNFYELLSLPGAMPCNREFFYSTEGRYGLEAKYITANGAMYVSSWTHNESIGLRKNDNYQNSKSVPASLSIFINESYEYAEDEFSKGNTDLLLLDYEPSDLKQSKYSISEYTSYYGGLIFNNDGVFGDYNLRKAFSLSVDRESYSGRITGGTAVDSKFVFENECVYNPVKAKEFLSASDKDTVNIRFIVPEGNYKDILSYQAQIWQRDLNVYFGITELSEKEYGDALRNGDFDIALVFIPYGSDDGGEELRCFCTNSAENYGKYSAGSFDNAVISYTKGNPSIRAAKEIISSDSAYIPILRLERYVYTQKSVKNIKYIRENNALYFGLARE